MMRTMVFLAVILICQSGFAQKLTERNFRANFDRYGVDGCFVLYNETDNEFVRFNADLCDSGYIPASTFKIPHALIALEEGIVKDTNQVIPWDGHEYPNKLWNQDQTLKTSMKYSCVWVYTGFAAQIGIDKYYDYVRSFDYGNQNLIGQPTRFWLAGLLRISANQQIEFLRKFYHEQLPVSAQSINMVKDIIVIEQTGTYKLSGKTGGGMLTDKEYFMWLVGYVERGERVYYYALNFISNDFNKTSQARYEIAKSILKELKILD